MLCCRSNSDFYGAWNDSSCERLFSSSYLIQGVETFEVFYEEDDESGTLIESGFETLRRVEMSR